MQAKGTHTNFMQKGPTQETRSLSGVVHNDRDAIRMKKRR